MVNPFEEKIKASFMLTKKELAEIKSGISDLTAELHRISEKNKVLFAKVSKARPVKKVSIVRSSKKRASKFIGARNSMLLHDPKCPFAKRILPKNRVVFRSKTKALNLGFKRCECLKKS